MEDILDQHLIDKEPPDDKQNAQAFFMFAILQLVGSIVAVTLAWNDIETIIGSGPTISFIGLIVFLFARLSKNRYGMLLGTVPLIASLISFCIIFFFKLSPDEATVPISSILSIFLLISILIAIFSFIRRN